MIRRVYERGLGMTCGVRVGYCGLGVRYGAVGSG